MLLRYPSVALLTFAWITLTFSALEFFGARLHLKDNWDPRKLPPLVKHSPRKSSFELIAQLLVQTIFGVWWLAGLHYQDLIFGPGIAFLHFGPVWQTIYPLFVVMVLVDVAVTAGMLIWPQWAQGRSVSRLVMSALGLVVLYFLINAPELFLPADASAAQLQALAKGINYGVHLGLVIAAIVNIVNIGVESVRLVGRKLAHVHQATVS